MFVHGFLQEKQMPTGKVTYISGVLYFSADSEAYGRELFRLQHISNTESVEEKSPLFMTVSPNPAIDFIRINIQTEERIQELFLTDALGKIRWVFDKNNFSSGQSLVRDIELSVQSLPPGVYRVVARTTSGNRTVSLVKL